MIFTGAAFDRATRREALARRGWVAGELAATRVPRLGKPEHSSAGAPTLAEAAERWRASRVDVTEGTAVGHRAQIGRVLPVVGARRVDEITPADVAELVAALHAAGRKRGTIRKSLTVLAQVLDYSGIKENPARDRIHVRLPREKRQEPTPPGADQIEAVLALMPRRYALAVLVLDATGMRVGELEEKGLRCGDLDEPNTRWQVHRLRHRRISVWHRQRALGADRRPRRPAVALGDRRHLHTRAARRPRTRPRAPRQPVGCCAQVMGGWSGEVRPSDLNDEIRREDAGATNCDGSGGAGENR